MPDRSFRNRVPAAAPARSVLRRLSGLPTAFLLLALAVLSACASAPPAEDGVRGLAVRSRVIGKEAAYVEITAAHGDYNQRLERITLVAPDGREIEAENIRTETVRYLGRGHGPFGSIGIGFGGYGGGYYGGGSYTGIGIGIGFPLVGGGGRRGTYWVKRATIKVPDPKGYKANPNAWKVALHFRHRAKGVSTVTRAAPLP